MQQSGHLPCRRNLQVGELAALHAREGYHLFPAWHLQILQRAWWGQACLSS